jgi:5-methylcytosine-specific restriction endonuclease McrA
MAEGRMLKKKISLNESVADLKNDTHRLLFTWGIPHLDIEGRMSGSPRAFKATVAPLLDHISVEEIEEFIEDAVERGLIIRYTIAQQTVIEYPNFKTNQKLNPEREAPSKLPSPEGKPPDKKKILGQYGYYGASWKRAKRIILDRDKVCQLCGKGSTIIKRLSKTVEKSLEVHHIIDFKLFNGDEQSANNPSNLIALCHGCHLRVRANRTLIEHLDIVHRKLNEQSLKAPLERKLKEVKGREDKSTDKPSTPPRQKFSANDLGKLWNEVAHPAMPRLILPLNNGRKNKFKAPLAEHPDPGWWRALFTKAGGIPGLRGENDRGWRADLEFVVKKRMEILEGKYDNWNQPLGITTPPVLKADPNCPTCQGIGIEYLENNTARPCGCRKEVT